MKIKVKGTIIINVNEPVSYREYVGLIEELVKNKTTSGLEPTAERITATPINLQRMKRVMKETVLAPELVAACNDLYQPRTWLVITEAWCGDAAQNLPVIAKLAESSGDKIQLRLIFRDKNPELMDHFLTNGTRSVPKLLCLNEANEVINIWGPRPQRIQNLLTEFKSESPAATHSDLMYHLHLNYFRDKGISVQKELLHMLEECSAKFTETEIGH